MSHRIDVRLFSFFRDANNIFLIYQVIKLTIKKVPVVIASGKKLPEIDALTMAYGAISDGAAGVDMGRNIFQSDSPVGMIQAVRAIVHGGNLVDEA